MILLWMVYINTDATPTVVHTPATSPIHWRKQIKEQLDKDIRLGVIVKVKSNTPVTWCPRAFWTCKTDGNPRRVVDLQSLNKHCIRDTRHAPPPPPPSSRPGLSHLTHGAQLLMHGMATIQYLCEKRDRHFFIFITEDGRYRYCVAPQG